MLLNSSVTYPVFDKLNARGEFGLGMLVFGGLDTADNIFVRQDAMATGALSSFNLRVALGAE